VHNASVPNWGFVDGLRVVPDGFRRLMADRRLTRLAVWPWLLTALGTILGVGAAVWGLGPLLAWVWPVPDPWWGQVLWWVVRVLSSALVVWGAGIAFGALGPVVAGPFYDRLVQVIFQDHRREVVDLGIGAALLEVGRGLLLGLTALAFAALTWLPGIGVVAGGLAAMFAAWSAGLGACMPALMARGLRRRERGRFVVRRAWWLIGLGAWITAGMLIPFLGWVVVPAAVIGATARLAGPTFTACSDPPTVRRTNSCPSP
jgi:uncharacterized protein involved in cysteine biosynthesis